MSARRRSRVYNAASLKQSVRYQYIKNVSKYQSRSSHPPVGSNYDALLCMPSSVCRYIWYPHTKYQPPFAYIPRWDWTIEGAGWGDAECLAYFRFSKSEIRELIVHLKLSDWVDSPRSRGYARSPEQALCMLFYRFSSPGRLKDKIQIFGVSQGRISSIANDLASYWYTQFQPVLYWNPVRLSLQWLQLYAAAVTATVGVQELGI